MARRKIPSGSVVSHAGNDSLYTVLADFGDDGITLKDSSGATFIAPPGAVAVKLSYVYAPPIVTLEPYNEA